MGRNLRMREGGLKRRGKGDRMLCTGEVSGGASKQAHPEQLCLVPKKGLVQTRLGSLVSETPDLSTSGQTQHQPLKVWQDPPKGKEPRVSTVNCSTPSSQLFLDTHVQGWEQGQKTRAKHLTSAVSAVLVNCATNPWELQPGQHFCKKVKGKGKHKLQLDTSQLEDHDLPASPGSTSLIILITDSRTAPRKEGQRQDQ